MDLRHPVDRNAFRRATFLSWLFQKNPSWRDSDDGNSRYFHRGCHPVDRNAFRRAAFLSISIVTVKFPSWLPPDTPSVCCGPLKILERQGFLECQHTATHCNTLQHAVTHLKDRNFQKFLKDKNFWNAEQISARNFWKTRISSKCLGMATISRLLKIIGLFCRLSSLL